MAVTDEEDTRAAEEAMPPFPPIPTADEMQDITLSAACRMNLDLIQMAAACDWESLPPLPDNITPWLSCVLTDIVTLIQYHANERGLFCNIFCTTWYDNQTEVSQSQTDRSQISIKLGKTIRMEDKLYRIPDGTRSLTDKILDYLALAFSQSGYEVIESFSPMYGRYLFISWRTDEISSEHIYEIISMTQVEFIRQGIDPTDIFR